ncbi:MAG: glycosyltransferase family protein [Betaproteobacteria bacterium]|nr:glycosyltransferase family protein [Betaproteobacteria bacterium]
MKVPRVLAILQARVSSSRLPGKALLPILGRPMLALQIERLVRCRKIDRLVVATSNHSSDDPLAALCADLGVLVYRGDLDDVLSRFAAAARPHAPDIVVRLTGDCPLADPLLIDEVIEHFLTGSFDYLSNCAPASYPDGLDVEVFSYRALLEAATEAELPSHREHVTPLRPQAARALCVGNHVADGDWSHMRWTVDEPEDFEFVQKVYERLYPQKPEFGSADILALLEADPLLGRVNARFERNEGARKSLQADAEYLTRKK